MANTPISGTKYILSTQTGPQTGGVAAWVTAVCLTSNGWQASGDDIDTSSKCTGDWSSTIPGRKGWSFSGEGNAIAGTLEAGTVSFNHYFSLWKAGTVFQAQMVNSDDDDDIIHGPVRISALEKTAPDNAVTTFSITLTGQGEPLNTPLA